MKISNIDCTEILAVEAALMLYTEGRTDSEKDSCR